MASLRAHLYDLAIRLAVKRRLGRTLDIYAIRRAFEGARFPAPVGVAFTAGTVGGVPGEWAQAEGARDGRPTLLYLHGGGFIACSAQVYRPVTGHFARAGFRVFTPDYRLAPEHPFPAAVEDCAAVWAALAPAGPAVVAGDSAGGTLALTTIIEARRLGLTPPAAAALFSPATDLIGRSASFRTNGRRDAMFRPESLMRLVPAYLAGADPADPRASPIEADFSGFPPLLIHVGAREILRDDSVRLAEKARAAGVPVELTVFPVVAHAWQLAESFLPEARRSLDGAAAFLRRALPSGAPSETGSAA
ncbi:alpha/beta hydrolase fold domain-containing protein [Methylobacterium sp. NI91]|nr:MULTISPECIES: alpha/beta hydrolase [unclassified Methylobacterium]QIJ76769.1 alpha/beta hydrolase fold domain-containing protein [Methylobacterium sp. CLZ]QIJ81672.1 alpha/beta hydrolase fold domain-containing protein [Methylobacterium sp. NI91]